MAAAVRMTRAGSDRRLLVEAESVPDRMAEAGLGWVRRRTGGLEGGERG